MPSLIDTKPVSALKSIVKFEANPVKSNVWPELLWLMPDQKALEFQLEDVTKYVAISALSQASYMKTLQRQN
jgi:hypothetical protein